MKKILYSSFAVLVAAAVLASCNKEGENIEPQNAEDLIEVTINAGKPGIEANTKTEMYEGNPYWSKGDAIGVTNAAASDATNNKFTTSIGSRSTTATFTGTSVSGDLYAYYPHQGIGVSASGAKVEIPVNQNPTATSFDGSADVMFSQGFTVSPANTSVSDLVFARAGAIVKVVFKDNTTGTVLSGQHPGIVTLTSAANLVGRMYLNVKEQRIGELYGNQSKTVNAIYTPSTQFAINGTNGAFIIVYPQTLEAGTDNLTITANTESYAISKTISVPAGGIKLDPGKITTLNIGIADDNIVSDPALTLPFEDDFDWLDGTAGDGTAITGSSTPALSALYSTGDKLYTTTNAGEIRLGNRSTPGYLTTVGINLSAASHITVSAKQFGSDASKIQVSVDGGEPIYATNDGSYLGASYKDYIFNLPAATAKSKVTISTSALRGFVNNIAIVTGAYVPPTDKTLPYDNALTGSHTDFEFDDVNPGSLTNVWKDNSAGVQANGYGTTADIEAYLVSPSIDLTGVSYAALSFEHSIRYFADVATAQAQTALQIKVGAGAWTNLVIPTYPDTQGDAFTSTTILLDDYCGNKVQLRFKYLATSTNPGRWRIKNFRVIEIDHSLTASPNPALIGGTSGNSATVTATSYYTLDYSITETGAFTVSQSGKVFTVTATGDGGAAEAKLGTVRIKEVADASHYVDVEIRQSKKPTGGTSSVTLTGTNMSNMTGTNGYGNDKTGTFGGFTWNSNGYRTNALMTMLQLRVRTHSSGVSYIQLPSFPGNIQSISMNVTDTNANAYSTSENACTGTLAVQSGNTSNETVLVSGTATSGVISLDLSAKSVKTGYIVSTNGGARIWEITVVYNND